MTETDWQPLGDSLVYLIRFKRGSEDVCGAAVASPRSSVKTRAVKVEKLRVEMRRYMDSGE